MNLISKYNIPVPRYTSYPTVPFWDKSPSLEEWKDLVKDCFNSTNSKDGISLYIHLPFCESLCTYCACNTRITVNHKVEEPYINTVLKEWDLYLELFNEKPLIREIHLGGGTPTFFTAENLKKLIQGILDKSNVALNAEFSFEAHPANTTIGHLITLYQLGFKRISFGIQDFDDKVQDAINRYQSFEEVKAIVDQCRAVGYTSVNFDLVYGLPFQTYASMQDTVEKVIALKPDRIAFYSYAHVPWIKPGQRKFTEKDLPVDDDKRKLYELGKEV
ncbi:MAG TPA: radical SAM protein, partial [Bacteroidia bacterium]|nr:radical SAM protein [Bacteroidia bacterium]